MSRRRSVLPTLALLGAVLLAASGHAAPGEPTQPSQSITVVLRWQAKVETRVYGYLVYRATERSGPFRRVSARLVRAVPTTDPQQVNKYEFVDREVVAGQRYFYYLDVVSTSGVKQRFSAVLSKLAGPAAEEPTPPPAAAADGESQS